MIPLRLPAQPWRARLVVVAGVLLLACVLLALLTDGGHFVSSSAQAITPTPRPTATHTPFPIPTPAEGFQVYVDRSQGFIVQYPSGWVPKPLPPAIVFADDQNAPNYIVQVLQPGAFTSVGANANPNDPNVWVDYELTNLARQWPQNDFARTTTTTDTQIGKVEWKCGVGLVAASVATPTPTGTAQATATSTPVTATATPTAPTSALTSCMGATDADSGATSATVTPTTTPHTTPGATASATPSVPDRCLVSTCIRVEVYATVYNGRPYIITLLASDDRFAAGAIEFFQPMLQSYEFLPASATTGS